MPAHIQHVKMVFNKNLVAILIKICLVTYDAHPLKQGVFKNTIPLVSVIVLLFKSTFLYKEEINSYKFSVVK